MKLHKWIWRDWLWKLRHRIKHGERHLGSTNGWNRLIRTSTDTGLGSMVICGSLIKGRGKTSKWANKNQRQYGQISLGNEGRRKSSRQTFSPCVRQAAITITVVPIVIFTISTLVTNSVRSVTKSDKTNTIASSGLNYRTKIGVTNSESIPET